MKSSFAFEEKELQSFERKVDRSAGPDGCHLWTAAKMPFGYGKFRKTYAHRRAWEIENKRLVPDGLNVCHHCDNPSCVNPKHLFIGTHADNIADKVSKDRQHRGEDVPNSILNAALVRKLRELQGTASLDKLSRRFGIHRNTIWKVHKRMTWRHVE